MRSSASQLVRTTFIYLAFLLITVCVIYPLGASAVANPPAASIAHSFLRWLGDASLIALAVAVTGVALASTIGYSLSRAHFLRRSSRLAGALFAQLLPAAILLGLVCVGLVWLGLVGSWLALLVIYLVTALPFCSWQLKRNYDSIPISLEEAAEVEGASAGKSFFSIVLPLAVPALAITFLFSLLAAWNEYLIGGIFLGERGTFAVPGRLDFAPQIMTLPAVSLLVSLPAVLLFLVLSRLLVSMSSSRAVEE